MKCLIFLLLVLVTVNAHSWMQCADYTEENGRYWDASRCRAYPRDYVNKFKWGNYVFGADVGMNYQPSENAACQSTSGTEAYSTSYPAAKYSVGQRVCLAWPPKNHVSARCVNPNIPDSGTAIYRSGVNPSSDPSLSQFRQNLVVDFGRNTAAGAGVGFQNCPDFCSNNDKALCTNCFTVPNMALGKYTFLWLWGFNSATDLYSTCFDVEIVANSGNRITSTLPFMGPDDFKSSGGSVVATTASITNTGTNNGGTTGATGATGASTATTATSSPTTYYSDPTYDPSNPDLLPTAPDGTPVCVNDAFCALGSERCNCTKGGACDPGLTCASGLCVYLTL